MQSRLTKKRRKGIVGHAAEKFTPETEKTARRIIREILEDASVLVSGGCHLEGVDILAEGIAKELRCYDEDYIFVPENLRWAPRGYRARNLKIARVSDEVHVIVVKKYPSNYDGMRFKFCYHCNSADHVKSGGCWTAKQAKELYGKPVFWHIIDGSEVWYR